MLTELFLEMSCFLPATIPYAVCAVALHSKCMLCDFCCCLPRSRAGSVLGLATNLSWLLSVLIHPYMPGISDEIQRQLQVGSSRILNKCI